MYINAIYNKITFGNLVTNFETGPKRVRMDQSNRVVYEFDWIIILWMALWNTLPYEHPGSEISHCFQKDVKPICLCWMNDDEFRI